MNIGVFGAGGTIGQRIVAEALSRGHTVTAFARIESRIPLDQDDGVRWKVASVLDADSIARVLGNLDVVVNSSGPGPSSNASGQYAAETLEGAIRNAGTLVTAAQALLKALEQRPALRLIVVGGAGSLEVQPGLQGVDSGPGLVAALQELGLPEGYKAIVEAHRDALNVYRQSNRNWTYFSPAHLTRPGGRTGRYRLGQNQIVIGADGHSRISCEDYAVALLDEVELPRHVQQRFTIGY
jgi:putative NADH-flavin reductase